MNRINIQPYNTFGINVIAHGLKIIQKNEDLNPVFEELKDLNFLIIGGGSNVLFTNDSYDGTIVLNQLKGIEIVSETDDEVIIKANSGEVWHEFVLYCIDKGYAGIENLSLIPGSVGASPMQNIGAYGVEIKDTFYSLEAYHIESGEIQTFDNSSCEFGYRESVFKRKLKNQYFITSVSFKLKKNNYTLNASYGAINSELEKNNISNPTIKDISNVVIAIRQSKLPDPKEIGNAGSFFKNPVVSNSIIEKIKVHYPNISVYPVDENNSKVAAGWLIEQAGWKGKTIDNYGVHKLQALVLVNYGGATGKQIYDLSTQIIEDIKSKFGIELEREVNMIL